MNIKLFIIDDISDIFQIIFQLMERNLALHLIMFSSSLSHLHQLPVCDITPKNPRHNIRRSILGTPLWTSLQCITRSRYCFRFCSIELEALRRRHVSNQVLSDPSNERPALFYFLAGLHSSRNIQLRQSRPHLCQSVLIYGTLHS